MFSTRFGVTVQAGAQRLNTSLIVQKTVPAMLQPSPRHHPVLIIGSGAAGYTAAIYAARASLNPGVVTGRQPGGQLTITTDVENYPGFASVIQGPWLMEQMRQQTLHVGATLHDDLIVRVDLSQQPFQAWGEQGAHYTADSLIIATGAQAKWLGIPGEARYQGMGVSACATCDGFFYKNQSVAVVGGGNTAVEEALYLTHHASQVILIHRRDSLRAEKILQQRLFAHPKISIIWDTEVLAVLGQDNPPAATHLHLRHRKTGVEQHLPIDGLFVAIGHQPATNIFQGMLPMDDHGYLRRHPDSTRTDVPGVFVAGDVADPVYRQAVTAAGMGCMAALDAERFLSGVKLL
jgi:thioredoxin reductase (NADPH)